MLRPPQTELWRAGFVPASITNLLDPAAWKPLASQIAWLPDPGRWRFLADPFGLQRAGKTHVFVEAFDYRTQHGVIEHHELSADLTWSGGSTVLRLPHHLSYPFIVEDGGEVFMVPEQYRANEIVLYRARRFPDEWVRETALLSGIPGAEPSLIRYEDRWWMFFTVVSHGKDLRELHVAHSPQLTGPWTLFPLNPVVNNLAGGRPGGTPFVGHDGKVTLPVQDCTSTYGGALRFVRFEHLSPERIVTQPVGGCLSGDLASPSDRDGFHTLSSCGSGACFDVKRFVYDWQRHVVDFRRRLTKRRSRWL